MIHPRSPPHYSTIDRHPNCAIDLTSLFAKFIQNDDRRNLISLSHRLTAPLDREFTSKLLRLCCELDAAECASSFLCGEINGAVPLPNEFSSSGLTPLHTAAKSMSSRCVEVLLKKHARTDLKSRDGKFLTPLELSLTAASEQVNWRAEDGSIEELMIRMGNQDTKTVRLLCEKTSTVQETAWKAAMSGNIIHLGFLLLNAKERVVNPYDSKTETKEKASIYDCVIKEAMSLKSSESNAGKRRILLLEIELLQIFGVVYTNYYDKKIVSPLIWSAQATDEDIVELLLRTPIDVNDVDSDGNTALHWIMHMLYENGAKVLQKNKVGMTVAHIAAGNGNVEMLRLAITAEPECVHTMTEMLETPLFLAVKNDHISCAEMLLIAGATTEILNIRRQRPIDIAISQDMRFLMNPTNLSLLLQSERVKWHCHPMIARHTGKFVNSSKRQMGAYEEASAFIYTRGGDRKASNGRKRRRWGISGGRLLWGDYLRRLTLVNSNGFLLTAVGGSHGFTADGLKEIFEEEFGEVEGAIVIGAHSNAGDEIQSRGFGFITFKAKESLSAAVDSHYVSILGKQVEIKAAVPKCVLQDEKNRTAARSPRGVPSDANLVTWFNKIFDDKKDEPQVERSDSWVSMFKNWFPSFLREATRNDGAYPLSSLKADFRTAFGLEMEHASIGYQKLSDFMKTLPDMCQIRLVPIDTTKPANHMILVPPETHSDTKRRFLPFPGTADDRFLQFLTPDPIFFHRTWLINESKRDGGGLVFPWQKPNSHTLFKRELDFYINYKASVNQGKCFGCNRRQVVWANFPCLHLLWCSECKFKALESDFYSDRKCVLCEADVISLVKQNGEETNNRSFFVHG